MFKNIYFIEKSNIEFNGDSLSSSKIRGAEKIIINVANQLANLNYKVSVFNNTPIEKKIKNVNWFFINKIYTAEPPDLLIASSDASLLNNIKCKNKYLWSHSVQNLEKFIRKKQLFAFIKNKPIVVVDGEYHFKNRSFLTSPFGKIIVPLAVDDIFIHTKISAEFIKNKIAIFTSQSYRNLSFLLECWDQIYKNSLNSQLLINPPYILSDSDKDKNIKLREMSSTENLIQDLLKSRVMLVPGHKGEVYCLAAEEARELCLPIVTMGYGCLKERVIHGETGFIANSKNEFIKYSLSVLNDDNLYNKLKSNLIKLRSIRTYKDVAKDFINQVSKNYKI
jgi:glycosyltransferase involved in cell wall biosynthesis